MNWEPREATFHLHCFGCDAERIEEGVTEPDTGWGMPDTVDCRNCGETMMTMKMGGTP